MTAPLSDDALDALDALDLRRHGAAYCRDATPGPVAAAYLDVVARLIVDAIEADGDVITKAEVKRAILFDAGLVDSTYPRPIPPEWRGLRVVMCRSCARDTGIPGAAYCSGCRPHRLNDDLMSPVDYAEEARA